MKHRLTIHGLFLGLLLGLISLPAMADQSLMAHAPWVREAPPMARMLAGYVTLENKTGHAIKITGANSPAFAAVEMHRSVIKNGMAEMIKQAYVTVPAHGSFSFSPGHYHLMLMHPKRALKAGDSIRMTLRTARGHTLSFEMPVRKAGAGEGGMHMPMNMKH